MIMIGGGGLYGLGSSLFSRSMICATRFEGRPANAAPSEVQMDGCTFGRDDQASSSRRRRRRNGVSGAARKVANGVARGANTPLAVEKQSGDRSGDRPSLAVALTREAGLGGEEAKESREFCRSDPKCALACDFSCHVSGSEGIACSLERTASVSVGKIDPPGWK